ncbi:glycosyltransferase [Gordonia amicalis]|nr:MULTISPECIES: glycosyltransferase [Gordonia]MCZ4653823.1 glycosyltransferase [Gordonia amicalis]WJG15676.1 glycosyltransferase [Gordonia sp. Swx-4]
MQGYPVVQTVRDYLTVCIRGGVDPSGNPCDGYAAGHCQHTCCGNLVDFFELLSLRCYNYQRRRVVSQFIAPSRSLAELCTQNGLNTIAVANPFYAKLGNLESISERNRNAFLYYGQVSRDKGVPNLLIAWKQFGQRHGNASLRIIGSIADDYRDEFTAMIREMPGVEYNDAMANSEILGLLPTVYCVIVPSIWMENYPNTVLESQAVKTLVIGSDRGGIREMITEPSLRFDPRDPQCLVKVLEAASALNDDEYGKIVEAGYQRVITENGPETYRQRIVAVIGEFRSPRGGVEAAA